MNIFLSTPISCFNDKTELKKYKKDVVSLIKAIKSNNYVCSEIENINDEADYDNPEKSIATDMNSIRNCDIFILHYPQKVPTSALIELGFAIAFDKRIIVIAPQKDVLPYLVHGISATNPASMIIESENINDLLIQKIVSLL